MGFYKRKAISLGAVRLSLARWGVGLSFVRPGARLAVGPRSTYVRMSRNGLSYRQRLDAAGPAAVSFETDLPGRETAATNGPEGGGLVASSSREVISQVNARASQAAHAPIIISVTVIVLLVSALFDSRSVMWVFAVGLGLAWLFYNGDIYKRTSDLFYDLADDAGREFALMQSAFQTLARSRQIWLVQQESFAQDSKRNGGESSVILRSRVRVRGRSAPWINTNVTIWTIDLGKAKLFFFPDRLLVWDSRKYRAVPYETLGVAFAPTRFIEGGKPPVDSEVVDHTWRYVDQAGEPDRRYRSNKKLPMVLYGSVIFGTQNQLIAHLHVSSTEAASKFAETFRSSVQGSESRRDANGTGTAPAEPGGQRQTPPRRSRPDGGGARVRGSVKWFSLEKGYGYITAESGQNVLVLLPQMLKDGLRSLPEGSVVEFEIAREARGPTAVNIAVMRKDQTWSGWRGPESSDAGEGAAMADPWVVLGLQLGASDDDVSAAYRRMAQMYHPDKVTSLGPELKQLADRKMREINAAYEALKRR
jgi:cold shock CspA family protein